MVPLYAIFPYEKLFFLQQGIHLCHNIPKQFCVKHIFGSRSFWNVICFLGVHVVQTDSGARPASFPIGTGGSFPGGKAAWA
jgi:hypothetical protein